MCVCVCAWFWGLNHTNLHLEDKVAFCLFVFAVLNKIIMCVCCCCYCVLSLDLWSTQSCQWEGRFTCLLQDDVACSLASPLCLFDLCSVGENLHSSQSEQELVSIFYFIFEKHRHLLSLCIVFRLLKITQHHLFIFLVFSWTF